MTDMREALRSAGLECRIEERQVIESRKIPRCAADAVILQYLGPKAALLGRRRARSTLSALVYGMSAGTCEGQLVSEFTVGPVTAMSDWASK
jgi:hypothetical protein